MAHVAQVAHGLQSERASVVLFGDSLTQYGFQEGGWAATVASHFTRRADVYNRGYGGYNSRWGRWILPQLLPEGASKHLLVTLWFGANDASVAGEHAHVPIGEFEANIRAMVELLLGRAIHVLVLTPPPVHGPTRLRYQQAKYGTEATGKLERSTGIAGRYAGAIRDVCRSLNIRVVDVWSAMLSEGDDKWPVLLGSTIPDGDGLHLSPDGQRYVGKLVIEAIEDVLGNVEKLPTELPRGRHIDPARWEMSIIQHQSQARRVQTGNGFRLEPAGGAVSGFITPSFVLGFLVGLGCSLLLLSWSHRAGPKVDRKT